MRLSTQAALDSSIPAPEGSFTLDRTVAKLDIDSMGSVARTLRSACQRTQGRHRLLRPGESGPRGTSGHAAILAPVHLSKSRGRGGREGASIQHR
jgi:hypothetical protein